MLILTALNFSDKLDAKSFAMIRHYICSHEFKIQAKLTPGIF